MKKKWLIISNFIGYQLIQLHQGGWIIFFKKILRLINLILYILLCFLGIPVVIFIRLISPICLIRIGALESSRLGHFAANTELYLCEKNSGINVPQKRYIDIFYCARHPICNNQLKLMWRRVLIIWPTWIMSPINWVNCFLPGGDLHNIGQNTQKDRDVHNLLDKTHPHLKFTDDEEVRGSSELLKMGIPAGSRFVCLIVRDGAYLKHQFKGWDFNYHDYRDSDIKNYKLMAKSLADRGFYVIRMGAVVRSPMEVNDERIIDYATNGMRTDFMDIYLGAKCSFCISVGTGFDAIPLIFRRPIAYVNMVPIGYLFTFSNKFIAICKHYIDLDRGCEMTFKEIIASGAAYFLNSSEFKRKNIGLSENTPEEIHDLAMEMADRLDGYWCPQVVDEHLQSKFWEIFPLYAKDEKGVPLHGKIFSRYGAAFLRNHRGWLQ